MFFLCHMGMVFEVITPYLKGFHLMLDKHLPKRDKAGWKFTDTEFVGHIESKVEDGFFSQEQADALLDATLWPSGDTQSSPPNTVTRDNYLWQCVESLKGL